MQLRQFCHANNLSPEILTKVRKYLEKSQCFQELSELIALNYPHLISRDEEKNLKISKKSLRLLKYFQIKEWKENPDF